MKIIINILLVLLFFPALVSSAYLLVLTFLSARLPSLPKSKTQYRFDVIVPAHNEESGIVRTVESLQAIEWPKDLFRVIVVADNCTDRTAEYALAAGATVLRRENATLRGKGYALLHAFDASLADDWADAYVVIDADSDVSPNILSEFAAHIARGEFAVQAHYGVRNPDKSWRTVLIAVAKGAFHIVRSRARERIGASCGIRGNGWCVTKELVKKVPYRAFTLTEDVEYGLTIGLAGYRVAYADEAHAKGDMVASADIAQTQRQRWEMGRFSLVRKFLPLLLKESFLKRNAVLFDQAMDLFVQPLSYVVMNILLVIVAAALLRPIAPESVFYVWGGVLCLIGLLIHVIRGWYVSGTGVQGLLALFRVPSYLLWKCWIMLGKKSSGWSRTERETK